MDSLGKIKGVAFSEFLGWYEQHHGPERILKVIAALPRDARFAFDVTRPAFGVLASHWYPAELVHELIDGVMVGYSEEELEHMAADAARFIMGRTLRGVYKTMFSMFATPPRYLRYAQRLWDTHYDSGSLIVEAIGSRAHRFTYRDWRGHHAFICRMNILSSVPIYAAMDCKLIQVENRRCIVDGGDECGSSVRWQ